MNIGFTGHRDCMVNEALLDALVEEFHECIAGKNAITKWIHGGAKGFDKQVERYALAHNISERRYFPDYDKYPGKVAPLMRNYTIVDNSDIIIACWDGRKSGGTYHAIQYTLKCNKPVRYWTPIKINNEV